MKFHHVRVKYLLSRLLTVLIPFSLCLSACGGSAPETSAPAAETKAASVPSQASAPDASAAKDDTSFTLFLYMIGSDLESMDSAASADIAEILEAQPSNGLTVLRQTGGAERWHTDGFREDVLQRHIIRDGTLTLAEELPQAQTSLPETLHDFLSWGADTAPADRYGVILWDHGGGATLGYGLDEFYPDESLSLSELCQAFEGLDIHFDFAGFDACLMGTMETAVAFAPYADYLLASEEYEPSTGWFYTDWIRMLDTHPSVPMEELGTVIVDDFVSEKNAGPYDFCTLALIDLKKIPAVYDAVRDWYRGYYESFDTQFNDLSRLRRSVKSYGDGNYEEVDLLDLLENSSTVPEELAAAAAGVVIHAAHNRPVDKAGGLSLYYPYIYPEKYDPTAGSMTHAGFQNEYFAYYDNFVTTIELAQKARAAKEERHDALGLVEAAGIFDSSSETPLSEGTAGAEIPLPADGNEGPDELHPEDVRFREYTRIHGISDEEAELISDVRLLQLNPTEDGFIFVGKESGGPVENGTGADLSGGHYLAIEDTLVSFELVYDSELAKKKPPISEETPKAEEETTGAENEKPGEPPVPQEENAETPEGEQGDDLNGQNSVYSSDIPDLGSLGDFGLRMAMFSLNNDLDPDAVGEEGEENAPEGHSDDWFRYGYVNAVLNDDQYVRLMVCWDSEHPDGIVAGYREIPKEAVDLHGTSLQMPHRGLQELKPGDRLHFYFHHFDKDGKYDGIVFPDEAVIVGEGGQDELRTGRCKKPFRHMEPGTLLMFLGDNVILGEGDAVIAYRITDVYNNIYYVRALDAWDPEDVLHLDPEHPEELWMELNRRYGAAPPQDNGPDNSPQSRTDNRQPARDTAGNAAGTAIDSNTVNDTVPADSIAAQTPSQETQNTAAAAADAVQEAVNAISEGSYAVIGSRETRPAEDTPEEYTDEEIDAFLNSELETEADERDDNEPAEQPATQAARQTQAETNAAAETQAESSAPSETEAPAAAPDMIDMGDGSEMLNPIFDYGDYDGEESDFGV